MLSSMPRRITVATAVLLAVVLILVTQRPRGSQQHMEGYTPYVVPVSSLSHKEVSLAPKYEVRLPKASHSISECMLMRR
jgi:hypothetical protein